MRKKYPSDVSRTQFEKIRPFLESARTKTRPRTVDLYEVFCAVLYLLKSGCQWRMLPSDFPNWKNVYVYFTIWTERKDNESSVLEQVLKKISRGMAYQTWKERQDEFLHRWCAERQECRYRWRKRLWRWEKGFWHKTPYFRGYERSSPLNPYHDSKRIGSWWSLGSNWEKQRTACIGEKSPGRWRLPWRSICNSCSRSHWSRCWGCETKWASYLQSSA